MFPLFCPALVFPVIPLFTPLWLPLATKRQKMHCNKGEIPINLDLKVSSPDQTRLVFLFSYFHPTISTLWHPARWIQCLLQSQPPLGPPWSSLTWQLLSSRWLLLMFLIFSLVSRVILRTNRQRVRGWERKKEDRKRVRVEADCLLTH